MRRSLSQRGTLHSSGFRRLVLAAGLGFASVIAVAPAQAQQMCGGVTYPFPYTDVSGVASQFCPAIMEAYVTGISRGTTPTTFSPNDDVNRYSMVTFLQRTVDQVLTRANRRGALNQWWTSASVATMQQIPLAGEPVACAADGEAIWTTNVSGNVYEVHASTGKLIGTWTGAANSWGVLAAGGKIFVAGHQAPGQLYVIDPTKPPGAVFVSVNNLGDYPIDIAFDGTNLWTANFGGSVSKISAVPPYTVTTITTGFTNPNAAVYDGHSVWVTDFNANSLFQLDSTGAIVNTVPVGTGPTGATFDGQNIWVPNQVSNTVTVVEASTAKVVATIAMDSNNQLDRPARAGFDGERILVSNLNGQSVTVFKAADLSFIANVTTGDMTNPYGTCSDGINFWVTFQGTGSNGALLRF